MTKYIYIVALLIGFNMANAQEIRYVNADNGLYLRDKPSQDSKRIDKLVYGTELEITERTNLKLDVQDSNEVISGEWVKVSCKDDIHNNRKGYVFNGFLTEEKIKKRFRVGFENFTVEFENLDAEMIDNPQLSTHASTNLDAIVEMGETLENKTIRIRHHSKYKKIEVFQRHENSISISNEGPHCDLTDWKHYYSAWEPLKVTNSSNMFTTITYSPRAWSKFIKVDMAEFKEAVKEHCGDEWHALVKDSKNINKGASTVSISKIYFKVIFTTMHDETIEKVIAFDVPMGC
ncbi:SH3 domain-containing protein [Seonamhaeicola maritimus]|uniref:SH3 domain-containing protein n=1 Tax=Seonamhaeicola maritimus TaxID=2591822 RepID=UPI0024940684|nr:SH3 domain-containing protein [Seonamhaeicola maritimus]